MTEEYIVFLIQQVNKQISTFANFKDWEKVKYWRNKRKLLQTKRLEIKRLQRPSRIKDL